MPWEYSLGFHFDMETLVSFMGGAESSEARLDTMFIKGLSESEQSNNDAGTTIFNPGNEPSFMTPFLYNYLPQRQHKSVQRSREVVDEYYTDGPSGIPGNDDAGSMSSWLVWNMVGLYPVAAQPLFSIALGDSGGVVRVVAEGLEDGPYVQELKVNGQIWTKSWISHSELTGNGTGSLLEFQLGAEQTKWDTGDVPPSPGHLLL